MKWFKREKSYDRYAILAAAEKARTKGNVRRAITAYRKVLEVDPTDHEIHGKVAPLLAERKQFAEAWRSFSKAGEGYLRDGYGDKALSMYTQASRYLPHQAEVWESIARLQVGRGRPPDAVKALIVGSRYFRGRKKRTQAIRLLRQAFDIEPWHFEATYTLARLLLKIGERREARQLLEGLAQRMEGRNLRRALATLFRMAPSLGAAWQWVRAAVAAREIPFPRRASWDMPAFKQPRKTRPVRIVSLGIALVGILVVGASITLDGGQQTYTIIVVGSGLVLAGLASFLFF
jgi:thioredoxin-like negative regulator of GroEL